MRVEVSIFNGIKSLMLKIPVIRNLFVKIESFVFDIFKIFDLRRYTGRSSKVKNEQNEKLILNFKKFYERNYSNNKLNAIIKYSEKRIRSAWRGHHYFALWLVKELQPLTIVDLGVDKGFSTFIFGAQNIGKVYGIDWFKKYCFLGDGIDDYIPTMRNKRKMEKKFLITNITIIRSKFSEVAKKWKKNIDILHIDGTHTYKDVKEDYQTWIKFLNENSIILFHDINIYKGLTRFFNELNLPKYKFTHSYGLGVVSKNKETISKIKEIWDEAKPKEN